jgi:glycosyltransferase involved in cell wall biosynthesis
MRLGQNPAKSIESVPQPARVTVAIVSYIPFLSGYYAHSLDVLKVCLESIWENTDLPYDLLVFDNASCPEARAFLTSAHQQNRIQYLVLSDRNMGKGGAWNFIFQAAPGEFIAYADSDIRFYPGWLSSSLAILEAYPRAGMVTARPMRTPEAFYSGSLEWARGEAEVVLENGRYIPWEVYLQHVLSLGTSEEQAREWYESRSDWRLTYNGVQALIGAAHFQFTVRKAIIQEFLPFSMNRPMGQVRSLDEQVNQAGYLRLTTCQPLVTHMGNQLPGEPPPSKSAAPERSRSLYDLPFIRKPLLRLYDAIFKLYHQ